ncbi:coagulation factor IX-like [Uranotaenia lowii]|uniref:coagulation factor IX-like n=1 Tax=Uranotaenia lowii TaxID=190385 RepID=UPI0024791891|nr:coagulation factor IX-like [Uranotaenia lowii]
MFSIPETFNYYTSTTTMFRFATLVVLFVVVGGLSAALQSPCPRIITYQRSEDSGDWFGYLTIPQLRGVKIADIKVVLLTSAILEQDETGHLSLFRSEDKTMRRIEYGDSAEFKLHFPRQNPQPYVKHIDVNGVVICEGPRAPSLFDTQSNIFYTLRIWTPRVRQQVRPSLFNEPRHIIRTFNRTESFSPGRFPIDIPSFFKNFGTGDTRLETLADEEDKIYDSGDESISVVQPPTQSTTTEKPLNAEITSNACYKDFTCGLTAIKGLTNLAIGGKNLEKGQLPWTVPLFDQEDHDNPVFICGSTIINRRFLITAAHCVYGIHDFLPAERILPVPGMYNIDNFLEKDAHLVQVEFVIPHGNYLHDEPLNDADVALLKLKEELCLSEHIIPVCIWRGEDDLGKILNQESIVAGWGLTERGQTKVPTFIRSYIVERKQCYTNLERSYPFNAKIFCADGRGSVPCRGDSGSGLVIKQGNQYFLRGVVSKGTVDRNTLKCDPQKYAVYTDVARFRAWMRKKMLNHL